MFLSKLLKEKMYNVDFIILRKFASLLEIVNLCDITHTSNRTKDIHQGVLCLVLAFGRMQFVTISFGIHSTDLQYEGREEMISKRDIEINTINSLYKSYFLLKIYK